MKHKQWLIIPVAILLLAGWMTFQPYEQTTTQTQVQSMPASDGLTWHGQVCLAINGESPSCSHPNTVTELGKNATRDKMMTATALAAFNVLQLSYDGNNSLSTNTVCPQNVTGSGLDIGVGTTTIQTSGNFSINRTWTSTGTVNGIYKICLLNSTAGGTSPLLASALMNSSVSTPTNVQSGDQMSVIYSLWLA